MLQAKRKKRKLFLSSGLYTKIKALFTNHTKMSRFSSSLISLKRTIRPRDFSENSRTSRYKMDLIRIKVLRMSNQNTTYRIKKMRWQLTYRVTRINRSLMPRWFIKTLLTSKQTKRASSLSFWMQKPLSHKNNSTKPSLSRILPNQGPLLSDRKAWTLCP